MTVENLDSFKEINKLKMQINELQKCNDRLSEYDPLTKLPNHYKLKKAMTLAIESKPEIDKALLVIDLDRFRAVNELYGKEVGDQVLVLISQRLQEQFTVYRGLEEFVIHSENTPFEELEALGEMVKATLEEPFEVGDHEVYISASIGISHYPQTGQTFNELLKQAEIAMKKAKKAGRGNIQVFEEKDAERIEYIRKLEFGLNKAIENEELYLVYQPKIRLYSMEMYGVEALLRWEHPQVGNVPPSDFIPLAEDSGHILKIGLWVLDTAVKQMKEWHDQGHYLSIAVNISVRQFRDPQLIKKVLDILDKYEVEPRYLTLEVTESVVKDVENAEISNQILDEHQFKVSIDDFGTGYSSLRDLSLSSVHSLKIDRSFTWQINENQRANELVKVIIDTANAINVDVLAEGIETEEQLNFLIEHGCRYGQGYYFSKPVAASEIIQYAKRNLQSFESL